MGDKDTVKVIVYSGQPGLCLLFAIQWYLGNLTFEVAILGILLVLSFMLTLAVGYLDMVLSHLCR